MGDEDAIIEIELFQHNKARLILDTCEEEMSAMINLENLYDSSTTNIFNSKLDTHASACYMQGLNNNQYILVKRYQEII